MERETYTQEYKIQKPAPFINNVLIIDDEPDICLLLRKLLIKMNLNVEFAYTIGTGLEIYNYSEPEIIFLDMNLPDGNGLDHIFDFKRTNNSCVIVMISAYDTTSDRAKAFDLGVNYFISKPFTHQQISDIVTEILNNTQKL